MNKRHNRFNLLGAIVVMAFVSIFIGGCFYVIHRPADTRTRDGITIYSEGLPDTWRFDKLMVKLQPKLLETMHSKVMGDKSYEKNEQGQPLIPGDVIYQVRMHFLCILSMGVGCILFVIIAIPICIYACVERKRDSKYEDA